MPFSLQKFSCQIDLTNTIIIIVYAHSFGAPMIIIILTGTHQCTWQNLHFFIYFFVFSIGFSFATYNTHSICCFIFFLVWNTYLIGTIVVCERGFQLKRLCVTLIVVVVKSSVFRYSKKIWLCQRNSTKWFTVVILDSFCFDIIKPREKKKNSEKIHHTRMVFECNQVWMCLSKIVVVFLNFKIDTYVLYIYIHINFAFNFFFSCQYSIREDRHKVHFSPTLTKFLTHRPHEPHNNKKKTSKLWGKNEQPFTGNLMQIEPENIKQVLNGFYFTLFR